MATKRVPCRLSISTNSLGESHAGHSLEHRLDQARRHGYQGIELFYDDLEYLARALPLVPPSRALGLAKPAPPPASARLAPPSTAPTDSQLVRAAALVRRMCSKRGLVVVCLQPFRHFEGLIDRTATEARLAELRLWCRLASILRTDLILIPSNFLSAVQLTGHLDILVEDLRAAAATAAAARPPVRLCYEALAWGTHVDTWQGSWEVVQRVDRANLGLCLDTFNLAARVYADPAVPGGVQTDGQEAMAASVRELRDAVPAERVFLVQVADGARLAAPIQPGHPLHDADMPARMAWSRSHRLFYGEGSSRGGYMPIACVLDAIFRGLGYRGWVSFELFNQRTSGTDASVPAEMARRGAASWAQMVGDFALLTDTAADPARVQKEVNAAGEDDERMDKTAEDGYCIDQARVRRTLWVRWMNACSV